MKKILYTTLLTHLVVLLGDASAQPNNAITLTVDAQKTFQTIDNFGASGCWYSEWIGKSWPIEKREKLAELLFSTKFEADGTPKGIGLSAWRFNIGGGTTEQGDSSGIVDVRRRVESFLNADGTYDWSKQAGYQWFLRKAKSYGVENLIAFANTPPVHFTKNGLGFKTVKDYKANLREDKYHAYAGFLTDVIKHFDKEGLHFNYICPVNEPQWDWYNKPGHASQEGSPWSNAEIYKVMKSVDASLSQKKLNTRILATEAGQLNFLYSGNTHASNQIPELFAKGGKYSMANLKHLLPTVAGHSYFTDNGDENMIRIRKNVADTAAKYKVDFWQTEYSMLGDGYKEGNKGRRSQLDCALFLAKVIHHDLTVANAAAWQLWNAWEPGGGEWDTRYYLMALHPNSDFTNGDFSITKNLWAFGNYSRFIRPGMQRVLITRKDELTPTQAAQDVMVSAFTGKGQKLVMVLINYTQQPRTIQPVFKNFRSTKTFRAYTTSQTDNLNASAEKKFTGDVILQPRSVTTLVFK